MQAEASRRGGDRDKEKRMKTRSQSNKKSAAAIAAVGLAAIVAAGVCLGAVFQKDLQSRRSLKISDSRCR